MNFLTCLISIKIRLDGGSYRLESGVSAREYPMCDDSFTTRVATTIQGYKKVRVTKCMS